MSHRTIKALKSMNASFSPHFRLRIKQCDHTILAKAPNATYQLPETQREGEGEGEV